MSTKYLSTPIDYGGTQINDFIPKEANAKFLEIQTDLQEIKNLQERLFEIIEKPIDSPSLKELIKKHYSKGKTIVILVDDYTRPNMHSRLILPILFPKILSFGVDAKDLKILVASGTHRPPTVEEIEKKILGLEIYNKYKSHVATHNCDDGVKQIGTSSRGTPIFLDVLALSSCLIISLTDSEYHYFAGIAGTVKQFFPGIAGRKTIRINHPRAFTKETGFRPECRLGNTEGNPVIQDMKEMVKIVMKTYPVFCIDAIIHRKKVVHLNAGNIISLHELAAKLLKPLRTIEVEKGGDLVIVTTGELGIDLYQAGKGIHAAWNATKKGGKILLLAKCQDGHGNKPFHDTMVTIKDMNLNDALAWVVANTCSEETFQIGNQKPVDLLRIFKDNTVDMITEMNPKDLKEIYRINPVEVKGNVQETLRNYVKNFLKTNPKGTIYVMADAGVYVTKKT